MPKKRADLQIVIRGAHGAGKPALARLLNELLRDEGLRRIRCEEADHAEWCTNRDFEQLRGRRIEIVTEQEP